MKLKITAPLTVQAGTQDYRKWRWIADHVTIYFDMETREVGRVLSEGGDTASGTRWYRVEVPDKDVAAFTARVVDMGIGVRVG